MSGFGGGPFGQFPFGRTNFGVETVITPFPEDYLEGDEERGAPLRKYLTVVANDVQQRKNEVDQLDDMIDIDEIRADVLKHLGTTLDIELDDFEPEEFQRSLVGNAVLFYQRKGTRTGYRVRGQISGFDVEVINFWKITNDNAEKIAVSGFPVTDVDDEPNLFEFPSGSGTISGIWFTDLPPGTVSGTAPDPVPGNPFPETCEYCLTAFIKIKFTLVKLPPAAVSVNFLDRVVEKLLEVTPIHVRRLFIDLEVFFEAVLEIQVLGQVEEEFQGNASLFNRYDIIPADVVATDQHPQVFGTATITTI